MVNELMIGREALKAAGFIPKRYKCRICGGTILEGDTVYDLNLDGDRVYICWDCIHDAKREAGDDC